MNNDRRIGEAVWRERTVQGLTAEAFGAVIGRAPVDLLRAEIGERRLETPELQRICAALRVPASRLLSMVTDPPARPKPRLVI